MSILPIVTWPDPRLAQVCVPVGGIGADARDLARDLLDTMYDAQGRGLAAPQVGALVRMFVMDIAWKDSAAAPVICVDPEIEVIDAAMLAYPEGCLSIPGVSSDVTRPRHVRLTWTDIDGTRHDRHFTDFGAVCVQHELDHLNGVVTLDHLNDEDRARVLSQYKAVNE